MPRSTVNTDGINSLVPVLDNVTDIGTSTKRFRNIYALNLEGTPSATSFTFGSADPRITLTAATPAANRTITIQDPLTDANVVTMEGTQTINGTKNFRNLTMPYSTLTNAGYGFIAMGEGSAGSKKCRITMTNNVGAPILCIMPDATSTTNVLHLGGGDNSYRAMTRQSFYAGSTISDAFGTEIQRITTAGVAVKSGQLFVEPTTNQIVLGTTNTTTISSTAPAASRTITIPDAGANSSIVLTEGATNVPGVKTFTNGLKLGGGTYQTTMSDCSEYNVSASDLIEGNWSTRKDGSVKFYKVGKTVTMEFSGGIYAATGVSTLSFFSGASPLAIGQDIYDWRPLIGNNFQGTMRWSIPVIDNSVYGTGVLQINALGIINIGTSVTSAGAIQGFVNAGDCGFFEGSVTWTTDG